ncbi:MAG TPA: hypothetical protein PK122_01950 [Candidatus Paceibacterota bacterium]|nr:hypothetical protein [Candidatus Paceibacterota bacterium]
MKNNTFVQENGMKIEEGKKYRSLVGDLILVKEINVEKNEMKCYNISESCNSWHRISSAIKDNKFRHTV